MQLRTLFTNRLCLVLCVLICALSFQALEAGELGIAKNGRHLTLDGKPFFWLGDTVWLLAQAPSREEIEIYLRARAEQGFTVIQLTAVMGEERVWGPARATSFGKTPFRDLDSFVPATTPGNDPNDPAQYDYWDHLDHVIDRIHAHGMRTALVTYFVAWRGEGYRHLNKERAYDYGRFLGERYRGKPDIFWLLGGDNTPDTADKKAVWNRVAKGIAEGLTGSEDYARVLMTYHINGGASSSQFWHESPWLDFNMAQTWSAYQDIYPMIHKDYLKMPAKPCGLGEGAYEDGPQYPTRPINALVIRKQACWSYFAGGYHTYGNGNVWHFDTLKPESTQPWRKALHSPGAVSLKHTRNFLESAQWWKQVPDPSLIKEGRGSAGQLNVAMRSEDNSSLIAYLTASGPVKFDLAKIGAGSELRARWMNPANGDESAWQPVEQPDQPFTMPAGWEDAFLHIQTVTK
jgi:hypothetical protein